MTLFQKIFKKYIDDLDPDKNILPAEWYWTCCRRNMRPRIDDEDNKGAPVEFFPGSRVKRLTQEWKSQQSICNEILQKPFDFNA